MSDFTENPPPSNAAALTRWLLLVGLTFAVLATGFYWVSTAVPAAAGDADERDGEPVRQGIAADGSETPEQLTSCDCDQWPTSVSAQLCSSDKYPLW